MRGHGRSRREASSAREAIVEARGPRRHPRLPDDVRVVAVLVSDAVVGVELVHEHAGAIRSNRTQSDAIRSSLTWCTSKPARRSSLCVPPCRNWALRSAIISCRGLVGGGGGGGKHSAHPAHVPEVHAHFAGHAET